MVKFKGRHDPVSDPTISCGRMPRRRPRERSKSKTYSILQRIDRRLLAEGLLNFSYFSGTVGLHRVKQQLPFLGRCISVQF